MKKIMLIAALMVATLSASAQGGPFIKPMAGGTLATMTGDVSDLKMKVGFVGGVELGYQFGNRFALTAGALYSMQGARISNDKVKYNVNMDYLNVPIMAAFYPVNGLGIKAGAQFGFLLNAKQGDEKIKDFCEKNDFSIPVGLSYEFDDVALDLRYNIGLSDVFKSETHGTYNGETYRSTSDGKTRNAVIMLTIGYKIPLY
jgi:opacity protein-like surface antigen